MSCPFSRLDESAIRNYSTKIDPLDKAGAYAVQGHGQQIIKRIDGSYTNVVGLPMEKTRRALRSFGVTPGASNWRLPAIVALWRQTPSLFPSGSSKKTA